MAAIKRFGEWFLWNGEWWFVGTLLLAFAVFTAWLLIFYDPPEKPVLEIRRYDDGTTCYIRHNSAVAGDAISCVGLGEALKE
jgi:hypothetical protein